MKEAYSQAEPDDLITATEPRVGWATRPQATSAARRPVGRCPATPPLSSGLPAGWPELAHTPPMAGSASPLAAEFLRLTIEKLREPVLAGCAVTGEEFAQAVAALLDPALTVVAPMTVAAWGAGGHDMTEMAALSVAGCLSADATGGVLLASARSSRLLKGQPADRPKPGGTDMTEAAAQDHVTVCHPAEDQMLLDFLAAQRATALDIVAGLDEGAWHRSVVPSGWTPAGLVEHLSGAQFHWFIGVVAGEVTSPPADADVEPYDPTAPFVTDWSSADIITEYREICGRSDAILAATPLSAAPRGKHGDPEVAEPPNVRWVVLHVIEEIARHCGHLDIGRELLDGTTRLGQKHSERPAAEPQAAR